MAAPSYTNDLATIVDFDGTPSSPSVAEPSTGWTAGRSPSVTTDYPIQSSNHCDLVMNTTGKAGSLCDNASSFTWSSGDYLFGWIVWTAPGAIATRAAGGLAMLCGSSTSVYKVFYVGGNAFGSYPYGGWQNFAVDPTMTPSETFGSPSAYYIVGGGANVLNTVSKGSPLGFDVFRYGRGTLRITGGSSGDGYATFTGVASANDATTARWGLFQAIPGGFLQKGVLHFGYGALTEFVDSNKSIVIDNAIWVNSNFNRIEIYNASSKVYWTNIAIRSLCTISPGQLEMFQAADVRFDGCTFINMDTFIFLSSAQITNSVFQGCKLITSGGGTFTGSKVQSSSVAANASAFKWNQATDPAGYLDDMYFSKGAAAHHAIEFGSLCPTTINLSGMTFFGFNAANGQNDSVLHFTATSGAYTVYTSGCIGTVSYKAEGTTTVNIISGVAVTISANVSLAGAEVRIYDLDTTPPEFGTELAGTESNPSSTYTYTGTATNIILIQIMLDGYEEYIQQYTIPASNTDLDVVLQVDENL